jgi:glycosyltransferase involved in cell wall biosynthesis
MGQRVTVIIPTFNRAGWLRLSLESVLAQEHQDITVLVCDNDSEDETAAVAAAFGDARIVYVKRKHNVGALQNHILAMDSVETEYVWILGDDNVADPRFLTETLPIAVANPRIGLVHTRFDLIDEDGVIIDHSMSVAGAVDPIEAGFTFIERSLGSRIRVCEAATLFRTTAVRDASFYLDDDDPLYDVGLFLRIGANWDVGFVPRSLLSFRVHEGAIGLQAVACTREGLVGSDGFPARNYLVKKAFVEANAPDPRTARRWVRIARSCRRAIMIDWVASLTKPARNTREILELLRAAAVEDRRILMEPMAWALVAVSVSGRRGERLARRLRRAVRREP